MEIEKPQTEVIPILSIENIPVSADRFIASSPYIRSLRNAQVLPPGTTYYERFDLLDTMSSQKMYASVPIDHAFDCMKDPIEPRLLLAGLYDQLQAIPSIPEEWGQNPGCVSLSDIATSPTILTIQRGLMQAQAMEQLTLQAYSLEDPYARNILLLLKEEASAILPSPDPFARRIPTLREALSEKPKYDSLKRYISVRSPLLVHGVPTFFGFPPADSLHW